MNYAIIDNDNICVNIVVWDGDANWNPGEGLTARIIENCGIGNEVEFVDGTWRVKEII